MFVINHKNIFFAFSGILVVLSIVAIFILGLHFGIDFTGGTITEIQVQDERDSAGALAIEERLKSAGFNQVILQHTESGYIIRTESLDETGHERLATALAGDDGMEFTEERFNSVGPTIGEELKHKAGWAILAVVVAIILFIAFVFRKVSEPVSSWKYGVIAIVALLHDIIIPTGIFAFLGSFLINYQVDVLFVTALLAILGFSVNDTIVVFDRVRENLRKNRDENLHRSFEETVGESLQQTYTRSLNTSLTTLFVLLTLYFFGGTSTEHFALTLAIGVVAGTYSSIFLASPLLVAVERWQRRKE